MEADVQKHRCEYHIQRDVEDKQKSQVKDLPQGGSSRTAVTGFLWAEASLQNYCLGAEMLQMHPQHCLNLSVLIWFSQREMHHPGAKGAPILFSSGNFPQMDNECNDYLAISPPAWCGRLTCAIQQVIICFICSSAILC